MKEKKQGGAWKIGVLALIIIVIIGIFIYRASAPAPATGSKQITVTVVHGDGTAKKFDLATERETLADALLEHKIVVDNQGPYGLYILTADGETADEKEQEWWCITKGGAEHMLGAGETPLADGEAYELTLTVGYDAQ